MIQDSFNRTHNYLRISLTDNCDLRCFYCMPEDNYQFTANEKLMQVEEIEAIARIFIQEGVRKIRLTGGEPLVRKDFPEIIKRLSKLGVQLTMTTNGTRIHHFIEDIVNAQIKTINVSLDTLQKERYQLMTKRDKQEQVLENIGLLMERGIHVKVNMVAIKGINDNEILEFIEWTRNSPIDVRFIEFMPFDRNRWQSDKVITLQEILSLVQEKHEVTSLDRGPHETAKHYKIPGHQGNFSVISTMSHPFCGDCNRMRLTADGKMKNCLFSVSETDLLGAYRKGEDIITLIHQNVQQKQQALGGQFSTDIEKIETAALHNRTMISIGG